MQELTIDLLRHGDVAGGVRLLGHEDEPLTRLGWQQLRSVVNGSTPPWTQIFSSPLQRCHAFANELSTQYHLPLIVEPRFKEIGFGDWEGMLFQDLSNGQAAEHFMSFWQNPSSNPAPGGEAYHLFEERVIAGWADLLERYNDQSTAHLLLVIHGGVIRTILRHILDFPTRNFFRVDVPYACLSRIKLNQSRQPQLLFHGGNL